MLPDFLRRWLADPKFIAFAQKFPLTRPVARVKSRELFDILAGFAYSQTLYACVSLKLFEHIGLTGSDLNTLSVKVDLPPQKLEVLVKSAVALELLRRDGDRLTLGNHGAALLGQPWIMRFVEHHKYFYRDLEDPVAVLRGQRVEGGLRSYWDYDNPTADKTGYSALMAASQAAVSAQILGAYDFAKHKRLLDVGGGAGAFLQAVGKQHSNVQRHLFDLPSVVNLAADENIKRHGGDFRRDPLPNGMDIISIVRVVHDHDDDAVLALLQNIRTVCSIDTVLLIAEPFSGNPATARVTDAYFGLYFAAMGQGKTRTPKEIARLAAQAGFGSPKHWPTDMPLITGVLTFRSKS